MNRKLKSQSINAPTSSGHYTPEDKSKQLNTPRLLTALLKLKRLETAKEVKVEKSLDGSCQIYVQLKFSIFPLFLSKIFNNQNSIQSISTAH